MASPPSPLNWNTFEKQNFHQLITELTHTTWIFSVDVHMAKNMLIDSCLSLCIVAIIYPSVYIYIRLYARTLT